MARAHRRPGRVPPVRPAARDRAGRGRAHAVVDPAAPAPGGNAADLARGRRHQLRDARTRPSAARLRHGRDQGRPRGATRGAGRDADHARRRRTGARPGRRGDRRRQWRHLAGGHDGRCGHRDPHRQHRRVVGGRPLGPVFDQQDSATAQTVLRGGQALRALHRPGAVRGGGRVGRPPAAPVRRWRHPARPHGRGGRRTSPVDHDADQPARPGRRGALRPRGNGAQVDPGRLQGFARYRRRRHRAGHRRAAELAR